MQGKQAKRNRVQFININMGTFVRSVLEWHARTLAKLFFKKGGEREKKMFCSYKAQEIYFLIILQNHHLSFLYCYYSIVVAIILVIIVVIIILFSFFSVSFSE